MQGRFANIIVDISHEKVDRPFAYRIPERLLGTLTPGMRVSIPFGKGDHLRTGYVMEITGRSAYPEEKLKEIADIVEGSMTLETDRIRLAAWLRETYGSTMNAALKTVLPVKQELKKKERKKIIRQYSIEETRAMLTLCEKKHQSAKARVLQELLREPRLPYELITGKLNVSASTLLSLEKQGAISIETESYYRNPVKLDTPQEAGKLLSPEQAHIVDAVMEEYRAEIYKTYLIRGITGSGKTEVYMELIEHVIALHRQCIMLIPEIALTYQTVLRFYKRFGDRISVMNSTLSAGERYDQWERARKGEIDIIIGPRSALFVPFPNLGMIIIDEEHENSYKSEMMPKYHARETAEYIAANHQASVILGSATPSLEAYYRAKEGKYTLFTLDRRLTGGQLPSVYTVDLREELKRGNRSIFSELLQQLITDRLERGEQTMLFLNRRGYAGFVSCRACGHVMKCPHCDVSLFQHRGGRMVCHYCGYEIKNVTKCPACGSSYLLGFKAGTQQIEDAINKRWPGARVVRMDADTTRNKDSYARILSAFSEGEADILVGTQMIVKGHDFPNVTLVGILAADLSLNVNDFRAGERTFQLLTQAAGRAGRGTKPGEVVIQTYRPEHYSITFSAKQDYEGFYEEEIIYRELMGYPPVSNLLAILIMTDQEESGKLLAEGLVSLVKDGRNRENELQIIGPAPATVGRVNDIYRFVIYLKSHNMTLLGQCREEIEEYMEARETGTESVQFDLNPMNSY